MSFPNWADQTDPIQPPTFNARHGRRMAGFLGIRIVEESRDRVLAEIELRDELLTANGTLAGGAIMAFADIIGARATILNLPPDTYTTTPGVEDQLLRWVRYGVSFGPRSKPAPPGTTNDGVADADKRRGWAAVGPDHPDPDGPATERPSSQTPPAGDQLR